MKVYCGNNIRRLREAAGLTQRELAGKMGVAHTTIVSWEKNRTEPKMGAVEQMATIFGCKKSDIIPNASDYFMERRAEDIEYARKGIADITKNIRVVPLSSGAVSAALKERNLSIDELSEQSGVSKAELENIISHDQTYVSWNTFWTLKNYIGMDILHWTNGFGQTAAVADIMSSASSDFTFLSSVEKSIVLRYRSADKITKAMVLRALNLEDNPK